MNQNSIKILQSDIVNITHGANLCVVMPSNIYECRFGDDVFVGPFCEIQKDVDIASRTRVQSHSFICSNTTIGEDCFIGHGVMFINDKFKGGLSKDFLPTIIGDRVLIGSNATILPVNICSDVIIGAGSVVSKDISKSGIYAGNPARFVKEMS